MTVFVDNAKLPFGRMLMSHLIADTEAELFEMVDKIGVQRKWYQRDASWPHFDISIEKRYKAISAGAVQTSYFQLGLMTAVGRFFGSIGRPDTAREWVELIHSGTIDNLRDL